MLDMNATTHGFVVEEPPPPYYTLERRTPRPVPVETGAGTGRGAGAGIRAGMEEWNGFHVGSDGMNPRTITREAPAAGAARGRNMNLRVDTGVNPVVHAVDENAEGDREEVLSRRTTYSTNSVRGAGVGTAAIPSIESGEGTRDEGKS